LACKDDNGKELSDITETQEWLKPYKGISFEIFEDGNGGIDTVLITSLNDQSYLIASTKLSNVSFSIERKGLELVINEHAQNIFARFNVPENSPVLIDSYACIDFDQHSGHVAEILNIYCCKCSPQDFPYFGFKISRNSGLIEYSKGGKIWTKKI
jgi:hypothetical protein